MLSEAALGRLGRDEVPRLVIGLSGGMDSICLLHRVMAAGLGKSIGAIHINHGLQPGADAFATWCEALCKDWQVELTVRTVEVSRVGNFEANARAARYAAFESILLPGDLLLLAHHADDQVETALFRLFRGSRVQGLQGMPMERPLGRGKLYRPLLAVTRRDIQTYARTQQLQWLDDPTNLDTALDRNWLRHQVIPLIEQRWPGVKASILGSLAREESRLSRLSSSARETLTALSLTPDSLDLSRLQALDTATFHRVMDAWFSQLGQPLPSGGLLRELREKFFQAEGGCIAVSGIELRVYQGRLYALRPLPAPDDLEEPLTPGILAVAGGTIETTRVHGPGLRADHEYHLRLRTGGETLHRRHTRRLKNLLQETGVPPWLRDRLPLIYHQDTLVALAAIPSWNLPMLLADHWSVSSAPPAQPAWQVSLHLVVLGTVPSARSN